MSHRPSALATSILEPESARPGTLGYITAHVRLHWPHGATLAEVRAALDAAQADAMRRAAGRILTDMEAGEERPQGAAVGRSGPGAGGSEGPRIPGPENAYKCAHCGRVLGGFEAGVAYVGTAPVCHPNDDGIDCYRRVTVYGEKLGARR